MEEFISEFGMTQHKLAISIGVPPRRIIEIVHGKRGITADTALRLSRFFGTSAGFWMNPQASYELRTQRRSRRIGGVSLPSLSSSPGLTHSLTHNWSVLRSVFGDVLID